MLLSRVCTRLGIVTGTCAGMWHILSEDQKVETLIKCRQIQADQSVTSRIPGRDVAFFGFRHCNYHVLRACFPKKVSHSPDYERFGQSECPTIDSGDYIEHLTRRQKNSPFGQATEICKTWLNDVVLENYRRKNANLPIISVPFCIDIANNPFPLAASPAQVVPKGSPFITDHEITRVYKLITHPDPRVQAIAKETFQFYKVNYERKYFTVTLSITPTPSPWTDPQWEDLWKQRSHGSHTKTTALHAINWRQELTDHLDAPRPQGYNPNIDRESQRFDGGL